MIFLFLQSLIDTLPLAEMPGTFICPGFRKECIIYGFFIILEQWRKWSCDQEHYDREQYDTDEFDYKSSLNHILGLKVLSTEYQSIRRCS